MSKYGDVHDIFNQHHIQTRAKLDLILAKNSEIDLNSDELEAKIDISKVVSCDTSNVVVSSSALPSGAASESSLAALNTKIVSCDTSSVSVASSALPSGAADSTKQDEIKALIGNTNSALAGVLSVSSPVISKFSSTPVNAEPIFGQSTYLWK